MKFENRGKLLTCIGLALMIAALDLILVRIYLYRIVQPVSTFIAVREIHAGTIIEPEDIREITVSGKYILAGTVTKKEEIEGRLCRKDTFIPAGALFYEAMLD